jgi:hypothetical protein
MGKKSRKFRLNRRLALLSGAAILIIAIGALVYWHYHTRSIQEVAVSPGKATTSPQSSSGSQTSSGTSSSSDKGISSSSSSTNSSNSQSPTDGTGKPPLTPAGDFVSSHAANLNGTDGTIEESVCNTTPGASCYIKFANVQNGTVKVLSTQVTNGGGSTSWLWNVKQTGLYSGTWNIVAVATLNGQTKTAQDITDLVVQ